ncbi:MAG TPA: HlyD family efflux transporter periplasmic adaptor subunit [Thermoanaerobaculia bacterium]|nr:HlyD family efflux transporter periplasmic adaptor subunit [Thermoanaerobaculia bacterium]
MDRAIDDSARRWRAGRRLAAAAAAAALLAALLVLLPGWLRPSLSRARILTARVERGPLQAVLSATGTVVPAFEQALSSPVETRVLQLLKRPGDTLHRGDAIVRLDLSALELEGSRLAEQMAQKANQQEQLRLSLARSLVDLEAQLETKRLDAEVLEARAAENRTLRQDGLVSAAALRVAEAEAKKATIEVRQLAAAVAAARGSTAAQLRSLALDLRILRRDRDEAARQLQLATARADRDGVLTWVVPEEGATVHRGDVLARVANLGSFRVEATISDVHSAQLAAGLPVRVVLDGQRQLAGRLASVDPTIENGALKFTVELADPGNPALRNNLRVDVLVATASRPSALLLRKGPFAREGEPESVFVVSGGEAVRRRVRFGLAGSEDLEVLSGLALGDEVIVSDVKDYLDLDRVRLRR